MILKSAIIRNSIHLIFSLFLMGSCGLFSFSGATFPSDIKTFSIREFDSEVAEGPTDMTKKLTEALGTNVLRLTSLTREEKDGDIQFEGVIKSFSYTNRRPTKSDDSNSNSVEEVPYLTIVVEVSYSNPSDKERSFTKKRFSAGEFPREGQSQKEQALVDEIFEKLVSDICSTSIDYW